MPKKTTTVRGGAQRNKPRGQKSFELVRPASDQPELEEISSTTVTTVSTTETVETSDEETGSEMSSGSEESSSINVAVPKTQADEMRSVASDASPRATRKKVLSTPLATSGTLTVETPSEETSSVVSTAPKGSASARLAARRQASQKSQARMTTLITAEHYGYVRKELVFIAILALIMFSAIIILHFVPGIGS